MDNEIRKAFKKCPFCSETIAIAAVKCRYCGEWIDNPSAVRTFGEYSYAQPVWHYVLLSLSTFSLYDLYWFYRTWRQLRDAENWDISPGWRLVGLLIPILNLFLFYGLFKKISNTVRTESGGFFISPGWMLLGWLGCNALASLPYPYWILSFLSILIIGTGQNALNKHWSNKQPHLTMRASLSVGQIVLLLLGGICWALYIISLTIPVSSL